MLRKTIPIVAALALTAGGALIAGSPTQATPTAGSLALAHTPTRFALSASGYGSRVVGGNVMAGSDRSAFSVIGCTNLAGLDKSNAEASVNLGDVHLSGVKTHQWTRKVNGTVSSYSQSSIASVSLANTATSNLYLSGVSSKSRAWHNGTGFHASTNTQLARIVLNIGGVKTTFPVPPRGGSVTVPGIATITLNKGTHKVGAHSALAFVDAVKLHVIATNSDVYLAHSRARIQDGVRSALFHGSAYSTKVNAAQGRVTSGPTPFIVMPCNGTKGKIVTRSIAHANLGNPISADGLTVSQRGRYVNGNPDAFERAAVAGVRLTSNLHVNAVVARAHVIKTSTGYHKDTRGSSTARVYYNNRRLAIPSSGVLTIPGVARIQANIVKRTTRGIEITGLRVTLLTGDLSVVNIAHAKVSLSPSGL